MDEETRQPRSQEDYMQMIQDVLKLSTPDEVFRWVEQRANAVTLVSVQDGKLAFAKGIRVGAWQQVLEQIATMINEAVV